MKTNILKSISAIVVLTWFCSFFVFAQRTISFQNKNGTTLRADVDPKTGCARRILDIRDHIRQYGFEKDKPTIQTVNNLATQLIDDYTSVLKISSKDIRSKKVDANGDWWFIDYEQIYSGIPVYNSEVSFTIDPQGTIVSLGARAFPKVKINTKAVITSAQAIKTGSQHFQCDSTTVKEAPQLVILPIENDSSFEYTLVWKLELLSERPHKDVVYFVDAANGTIVNNYSNVMESDLYGYITGNYYPVRVYDPTVNSAYSTTNIKMYNIYGQLVATLNTDANGYYIKSGIAYTYYYLQVPLENSWIRMRNNADGGNPIVVTIATLPGRRDYDWSAGDGTNVRWHASRVHDFFKSTPLNYSGMDYQMEGRINAVDQYGYPYNGAADGTNILFGTENGQYWARSSDVVYHEYTHNTVYHIYGGWIGNPNQYYIQASAMDEGFSDYYACTINNDAVQGEDVGVSRNLDNNTYQWNENMGAHWNGQVIGGACWDLRQAVGQSVTDNLVFKALQITPRARNFADYLRNILLADNSTYSGTYRTQILAAFSGHGITIPALSVNISGPSEVYTPTQKGQPQTVFTWTAVVTGGVSPFSFTWNNNFYGNANFTSNGSTYTGRFGWPGYGAGGYSVFTLSVNVTDAIGQTAGATKDITVWYEMMEKKGQVTIDVPTVYSMSSNYPNPFNPSTNISYQLPVEGMVKLVIFDLLGREAATIVNELKRPGYYTAIFDASSFPSGIYFARISVASNEGKPFVQTMKMLLTK